MAISFSTLPEKVMPVYNPIYFRASSTNVSQQNFNFIYDIYTGTTGTTLVNRERLPVYPDGLGQFSPAGILQSLLGYDIPVNTIGGINQSRSLIPYYVYFGEEYGSLTTGVTTYANLNYSSGFTFTSVLNYDEVPIWQYTAYTMNYSLGKFLTKSPSTINIRDNDRETLSYLNLTSGDTGDVNTKKGKVLLITTYQLSGGSKIFPIYLTAATASTITSRLMHVGTGIWNLNNLNNSVFTFGVGSVPVVNVNTDYQYDARIWAADAPNILDAPLSETKTYNIDDSCTKYQPVRLMWLNSLGGFDYYNFILVSRTTMNLERKTFKRNLPYNYSVGDAGFTVSDIQARESVQITSDWLGDSQSQWFKELFKSKDVYELQTDGTYLPIILDMNSVEIKKTINDKLINYQIAYTYAFKVGTMRA